MHINSRIYIAGHTGMVGTSFLRLLKEKGYKNLILKTSSELDLRNKAQVEKLMKKERPEYLFLFAARVGGIKDNLEHPVEFLYDNLMIESNIIHAAFNSKIKKLLFLSSSCIYPRSCPQPMKEEYLLTGRLEPTNEAYALAKIAGLKLCEYYNRQYGCCFFSLMPPNLYGPNDNFKPETSHVMAALIRKFVAAKTSNASNVVNWGTGKARREFLYVDDLSDACLFYINKFKRGSFPYFINVGTGRDITISELSVLVKNLTGYKGKIKWNSAMPDGMPQKLLDITVQKSFNWAPKVSLEAGITKTINWYRNEYLPKNRKS